MLPPVNREKINQLGVVLAHMTDISEETVRRIRNTTDDSLELLEREIFHAFDEAYRQYHQQDANNIAEITRYETALETIRSVREIREQILEDEVNGLMGFEER